MSEKDAAPSAPHQHRPEDDLAFIRRLMEGAQENVSDSSAHLILWGCLVATAECLTYLALQGVLSVSINVLWAVAVGIGFAVSWLFAHRSRKSAPVNSLVNRILAAIWIGCALALTLVGFLGAGTGSLPSQVAPGVTGVIIGSAFFASAFLPGRTTYRLLAAVWWILGGSMLVWPFPESGLVIACGLILFMVVPGLVLRARRGTPIRSQ